MSRRAVGQPQGYCHSSVEPHPVPSRVVGPPPEPASEEVRDSDPCLFERGSVEIHLLIACIMWFDFAERMLELMDGFLKSDPVSLQKDILDHVEYTVSRWGVSFDDFKAY
ncbi:uncharacterized protein A4U43_C01F17340 [Asparagus officinalis]|uniref:Uncharacterized protein n=1 Tax=Asparagus officinalis TaxID=4686 RepID=A0A5P1FQB2_ASPOF|nr:uncharacterized protein A4U43_C01F17340 [Asparagus officinalis]